MTAFALFAMLLTAGFAPPQAKAVVHYAWLESRLQPCAHSRMGEGLIGVAGKMRRKLHEYARMSGCVPAQVQIAFLAREWPKNYAKCAARFNAGELWRFRFCWGKGYRG